MLQTEESRWFSEQVVQHEPALRAYLMRRFPSLSDQDDLIQESYTRTVTAWKTGRLTSVRGFLFTAARNIAIDAIRTRVGHERHTDERMLPLLEDLPSVPEEIDRQQRKLVLVDALTSLPPQCRKVMTCRYRDGLSYQQIAALLGLSTQTVKGHLVKGMKDCIQYFQDRGMLEAADIIRVLS